MRRHLVAIAALALVVVASGSGQVPESLERATDAWQTDFSIGSIELSELVVGVAAGDPRDIVQPLDDPHFQTVAQADVWLTSDEPGVVLDHGDVARFYPLRILNRHEVINDRIGDTPVLVTYCPLCNSAVVFDPTVDGTRLRFGTSGLLRNSNLVMWDDATESLWQQVTGEAIVGQHTGARLHPLASAILRWRDFASRHQDGQVLGRNQGRKVLYGDNPYVGYSRRSAPLGEFFDGEVDQRLPALERVVGVSWGGENAAVPFSVAREREAVDIEVGGRPVVVLWGAASTTDALEAFTIAAGDPIGTALAYSTEIDRVTVTLEPIASDRFVDRETGSEWTLLGEAIAGPLRGTRLELVPHTNEFWFVWQAFNDPDRLVRG
jgi:hypothetical protein